MDFVLRSITAFFAVFYMGRGLLTLFAPQPNRWKRLGVYVTLYTIMTMPSWVGDENPILLFPFFMGAILFCLPGDRIPRLVTGAIFFTLLVSLNMLMDSVYGGNLTTFIVMIAKMAIWLLLAQLLERMAPKGGLQLRPRLWLLLGSLTLAPMTAMLSFSLWGYRLIDDLHYEFYFHSLRRLGFTMLPFVLVSALALLFAAVVLSRSEALEQQSRLAALREVYYTGIRQEQLQLRTLRHDLRNHITALQGLLEQGKPSELGRYLSQLCDSPALDGSRRYTENETANVVLCSKAAQMEAVGLVPNFFIQLPRSLSLPAPELCALLGNALDNAIEGAAGADSSAITLRARVEKGMFMLQVQNPITGAVKPDLSTTKPNPAQHGYGLTSMGEIARRYGGSLDTTVQNGSFELLVCFPCKADNSTEDVSQGEDRPLPPELIL